MKSFQNSKIKVLHVLTLGTVGGMERYVLSLCRHADRERFNITVCILFSGGAVSEEIRKLGFQVIVLNMRNGFDLPRAMKLRSIVRRGGFHTVNIHGENPLGKVCTILGRPGMIIHTDHGVSIGSRLKRKGRVVFFNRLLCPFIDHFVAISKGMIESLQRREKVPAHKITLLYNGIDVEAISSANGDLKTLKEELKIGESIFVLGMVGRVAVEKEYPLLLESLALLKEKRDDFVALIIGDGPCKDSVEALAMKMGLSRQVLFLGERHDVADLLKMMDIFVFSSAAEAFSLTLLEAMAAGKPIVAFDVEGVNEAVVDGETGFLVPFGDCRIFSEKIESLMDKGGEIKKMGAAAFNRVNTHFTLRENIKALEGLYLSLYSQLNVAKHVDKRIKTKYRAR